LDSELLTLFTTVVDILILFTIWYNKLGRL